MRGKRASLYSSAEIFQAIEKDPVLKQRFRCYGWASQYAAGSKLLEMGCELGVGAYYLAQRARLVLAIDRSLDWLRHATRLFRRGNLHFVAMDCAHLAVADNAFDVICLFEVIEHVVNPEKVLSETRRTLTESGTFLLSTPNRLAAMAGEGFVAPGDHVREFSYLEVQDLIRCFYSDFEFYGQRGLEIMPLQGATGYPHFHSFSRFLVACRKSTNIVPSRKED